jgi:hypothetical protein
MRVIGTCSSASAAVRSHDPRVSGRRGDLWVLQGRGKSRDTVILFKDFFLAVMLSSDSAWIGHSHHPGAIRMPKST